MISQSITIMQQKR